MLFFCFKTLTFSEDSNSGNFEAGNSSESEFVSGPSKADTSECIFFYHTAFPAFRTDMSDREIVPRASSMLQDAGIMTAEDKNLVINKDKVR